MRARRFFTGAGVALLVLSGLPASADTEADAEAEGVLVVEDPTGDANFINGWGIGGWGVAPLHEGPDTRPASIDGADIERIWFSTPFETVKTLGPDGAVERVSYVPEAFRVRIRTHGDVGPDPLVTSSLLFRVRVSSLDTPGGTPCTGLKFEAWIRGPEAPPEHPESRAQIRHHFPAVSGDPPRPHPCHPVGGRLSESYSLSVDGNMITMDYPLDLLMPAMGDGTRLTGSPAFLCIPGTDQCSNRKPSVRVVLPGDPRNPWGPGQSDEGGPGGVHPNTIDETDRIATFTVGSDVPPDVVCSEEPEHPDCEA